MEDYFKKLERQLQESECYAAMLFGSYARDEEFNDIDIAVFTDSDIYRISGETPSVFDVSRFQDLPMYIRKQVLEEGEVIYLEDEEKFYDQVIRFVRNYERFKPIYKDYLEGVKARG